MSDLAAKLELIAAHAPKLRKAGVIEVDVDGVRVKLAPDVGESDMKGDTESEPDSIWDDPSLYGRNPGRPVPGIGERRPRGKRRS